MDEQQSIGLEDVAAVHSGAATLYHSLGHIIRSKIQSGEWAIGQQIPSEREMMKIFNLSRATVRQGIENLVKEGVLKRVRGKGTFVSPPKVEHGILRLLEFSDVLEQNGLRPVIHLTGRGCATQPANVQKILGLSDAEQAIWLQCLVSVSGEPILIETCYFSTRRFPGLLEDDPGSEEPFKFALRKHGVHVARARETFEPVILESEEAALLGTAAGVPALWVEEIAYDSAGETVLYLTSLLRGDRCRFYTELVFEKPQP